MAAADDDVYVVYARSTHPEVKLVQFITEFSEAFPRSLMRAQEQTLLFVRKSGRDIVAASNPQLSSAVTDSLTRWLVPFNPMKIDTFIVAMRVSPIRVSIAASSRDLASPHARLVSARPWFRKDTVRLTGKGRPGMNDFSAPHVEPSYNIDTLGSYVIYPTAARGRNLNGMVVVAAMVNTDGFADEIVIVQSSHDVFDQTAARAVKCLRFQPGQVHGAPTRMWVLVPISFSSQ